MKLLAPCAAVLFTSACALGAVANPIDSKTWYADAAVRLSEINDKLMPPARGLPVSDAMLASMIYDRLQDEPTAAILETLAKVQIQTPASLPEDSIQRGVYSFVQLGHLQAAYMPMFAKMSAQAADDLFKKAKSPVNESAVNEIPLAKLWMRLGETEKALAVLDPKSSLHLEYRTELIRTAYAAAKVNEARALADSTLEMIRATEKDDLTDQYARDLSVLVVALVGCGEIDKAREAMKEMPPSEDALPAYRAICEYSRNHGDDEAFAADVNALVEMVAAMGEYDLGQTLACVRAAEICTKLRRDAEAVKCLDRFDQLAVQPDPPLTLHITWAEAARVSLYTTANDRANGYLDRCAKAIAADKEADDEDRLRVDLAMARVYGVRGDVDEFQKRLAEINPRLKAAKSFMANLMGQDMLVELARVSRDEKLVAQITAEAKRPRNGRLALAMSMRLAATGQIDEAWALATSIDETNWRLRAIIEVTHARMQIHDEAEQLAALLDVRGLASPRESAYILLAVGARLDGEQGYAGDAMMRSNGID